MKLNKITLRDLQLISDKLITDENILKVEFSSQNCNSISLIWLTEKSNQQIGSFSIDNNFQVIASNGLLKDKEKIQKIVDEYFEKK